MKTKISAVLMVLILSFALVSCNSNESFLIGEWDSTEIMQGDTNVENLGLNIDDFKMEFTFNEDGTGSMYFQGATANGNWTIVEGGYTFSDSITTITLTKDGDLLKAQAGNDITVTLQKAS